MKISLGRGLVPLLILFTLLTLFIGICIQNLSGMSNDSKTPTLFSSLHSTPGVVHKREQLAHAKLKVKQIQRQQEIARKLRDLERQRELLQEEEELLDAKYKEEQAEVSLKIYESQELNSRLSEFDEFESNQVPGSEMITAVENVPETENLPSVPENPIHMSAHENVSMPISCIYNVNCSSEFKPLVSHNIDHNFANVTSVYNPPLVSHNVSNLTPRDSFVTWSPPNDGNYSNMNYVPTANEFVHPSNMASYSQAYMPTSNIFPVNYVESSQYRANNGFIGNDHTVYDASNNHAYDAAVSSHYVCNTVPNSVNLVPTGNAFVSASNGNAYVANSNYIPINYSTPVDNFVPMRNNVPVTVFNHSMPNDNYYDHVSMSNVKQIKPNIENVMAKLCEAMTTPKLEYLTFNGNPLNYSSFLHNFESCLENQTRDNSTKLQLLIQHCTGKARDAIESCVSLPPNEAYRTAKETLRENFGTPHKIATAHIQKLRNLPDVKVADGTNLLEFARNLETSYRTLLGMGSDYLSDLNHSKTLIELSHKLPTFLKAKWIERAGYKIQSDMKPKFDDFLSFVKERAKLVNNEFGEEFNAHSAGKHSDRPKTKAVTTLRPASTMVTAESKNQNKTFSKGDNHTLNRKCEYCKESHFIWNCNSFPKISAQDRAKFAIENSLCLRCLNSGHYSKTCKRNLKCGIDGCDRNHNTLLHGADFSLFRKNDKTVSTDRSSLTVATGAGEKRICLGVIPCKVKINDSDFVKTYVLQDNASELCLCSQKLVDSLGQGNSKKQSLKLTGITGTADLLSQDVDITVMSMDESVSYELKGVKTVQDLPISKTVIPMSKDLKPFSHLRNISIDDLAESDVTLLIGVKQNPGMFIPLECRYGKEDEPIAVKYGLGWTILGALGDETKATSHSINFTKFDSCLNDDSLNDADSLKKQLDRLWTADFKDCDVSDGVQMSIEDKRALDIITDTLQMVDGHFEVALPWKDANPFLPDNRRVVEGRLNSLKKRFMRDPGLYEKYKIGIQDYLEKGHAELVPKTDLDLKHKLWYLPHHPVFHPLKPEKVRVVFDCACSYANTSLNKNLLQGPDLAGGLTGVLLRFRQEIIGITSDVEAMFSQVRVAKDDCNALRFLWFKNNDLNGPIEEYRMLKHIFGATSSPCVANFCIKHCAESNRNDFDSQTISTVEKNMYVDDLMKSVDSVDKALSLYRGVTELLSRGGFHITKWCSNSKQLLTVIPGAERAKSLVNLDADMPIESALGVKWDTNSDTFVWIKPFDKNVTDSCKPVTRRSVLSVLYSYFDPLGIIAPFIMKGKLLLQMLSRKQLTWDDPISDEDRLQWNRWLSDSNQLNKIEIPRCYKSKDLSDIIDVQLHAFSDASRVGYSSVLYLRFVDKRNNIHCAFVIGKARLAPIREISIPRLELSAVVLSVKLCQMVREELEYDINSIFYWTDSMSVLKCINNENKRFHTFESNRLTIIHSAANPSQFRYVERNINPADDGSKGLKLKSFIQNSRWLTGPEFLSEEEYLWPKIANVPPLLDTDPEVRKEAKIYVVKNEVDDLIEKLFNHYSSFWKLKRAVAMILRLKTILRNRVSDHVSDSNLADYLTVKELQIAEIEILKHVQKRSKWCKIKRNISVGDLVLLTDENFSRGQWPLAVVVEAVKSKDGLVRTVKVRTRSTVATCAKRRGHTEIKDNFITLTRPIHKICVLELDQSDADPTSDN